jgi:hypothetical protein
MKKQISVALLGLALMLTAVVGAFAQAAGSMRIHVPFDFVAGSKRLPAGDYTVRRVRSDAESALIIRSDDGRDAAVVMTNAGGEDTSRAAMSFRQYGERYFLAEISIPGTSTVRELPKTGNEKRAEGELIEEASAGTTVRNVTVFGSGQ